MKPAANWVPGKGWVEYDTENTGYASTIPAIRPGPIPCKPESSPEDAQEYPLPAGTGTGGSAREEMCCLIAPETGEFDVEPIPQSEIPEDWQWIEYAHAKDKTDFYVYESTQTDPDTGLKHR
ncbi:MAG: hypothetical protein OEW85_02905, partial [Acidimicrobiia bacterium]|nr:hypothetical protein [Acidimicrobiia bacterium]